MSPFPGLLPIIISSTNPPATGNIVLWGRSDDITGLSHGDDIYANGNHFADRSSNAYWIAGPAGDGNSQNPTYDTATTLNGIASIKFVAANIQTFLIYAGTTPEQLVTSGQTEGSVVMVGIYNADPPAAGRGPWQCGDYSSGATTKYDHGTVIPYSDGNIYDSTFTTVRKSGFSSSGSMDSVFHYLVRSKASQWDCHLNGTQLHTTTSNTFNDNDLDGFRWGQNSIPLGDGGGTTYVDGYMWELIVWDKYLTDTEKTDLYTYFTSQWGL